MREFKSVYWSKNRLGESLVRTLDEYALIGVLEKRDEPDLQHRGCADYRTHVGP